MKIPCFSLRFKQQIIYSAILQKHTEEKLTQTLQESLNDTKHSKP